MYELAPAHEPFWAETYGRVAQTGVPTRFEHQAEALDRWYDVFAFRVGRPIERQVALLFRDISHEVRARTAAGNAARRKDEFMAILAHELRNALSPMRLAVRLARMAPGKDDVTSALDMIDRQITHQEALITDLGDLGEIARGDLKLGMTLCDLRQVVELASDMVRNSIESRSQTYKKHLPNESVMVRGDVRRLVQAVSNLLLNASKYTPTTGKLVASISVEGRAAVIKVKDNGAGIPANRLADIFDLFSQIDATRHRSEGGLGIGLAVARSVAQLHGGTIEAHSNGPGTGSEFASPCLWRTTAQCTELAGLQAQIQHCLHAFPVGILWGFASLAA